MGTLMELQDVWKIYRMGEFDVPALQGINMRIEASEFVAIYIGNIPDHKNTWRWQQP